MEYTALEKLTIGLLALCKMIGMALIGLVAIAITLAIIYICWFAWINRPVED